jgi:membrane protein DedA with SNARE-associated domain
MISAFIASYGYLAVFVGTLFEGETVLIAAGFAAHRGILDIKIVVLVAVVGGILGDQISFWFGRWKGNALIARVPFLAQRKPRIHELLERYDVISILIVRFLYGLRVAGPVIMGSSRIPFMKFTFFDMLGAILWATVVSGAGYLFGMAISTWIDNLREIEEMLLLAILLIGLGLWGWRAWHAAASLRTGKNKENIK